MSFSLPELQLQSIAETVDIASSRVECDAVETATRGQHTNKRWHCYRAGHITAINQSINSLITEISKRTSTCETNTM